MQNQLLILPFDHRNSFKKLLDNPTNQEVTKLKEMVFEGFLKTREKYKTKDPFTILIDEEFGTPIIEKAKNLGVNVAVAVEKSGQDEFAFEYGNQFGEHLAKVNPTYVKVLVRYNPQNVDTNKTQLERLETLSHYCKETNRKLLFELLVPPTKEEKDNIKYDTDTRPKHTLWAINEIKTRVHVDIWKLEWFEKEAWKEILKIINPDAKVIVLGRGADTQIVKTWLQDAASYEQIIGFAVGRTVFLEPLQDYLNKKITKDIAIEKISQNFNEFVQLWYKEKGLI